MRPLIVYLRSSEWISANLPSIISEEVMLMPFGRWPKTCHEIYEATRTSVHAIEEDEVSEAINEARRRAETILGETPVAIITADAEYDNPIIVLVGNKKSIVCTNYVSY